MFLKTIIKNLILEELTAEKIENLKPNDVVEVYHGTNLSQIPWLINGFDANEITPRHYGGPKHKGLYVSPTIETARRFGSVILELMVRAKFLHGVDWSGNIGRKDKDSWKWVEEYHPNSFRPHLSHTLLDKGEPQALLRGLVSPKQITRIYYEGQWYSRNEFVELGLSTKPAPHPIRGGGSYSSEKNIRDFGYDLSSTNYSLSEYLEIIQDITAGNRSVDRILESLLRHLSYGDDEIISFLMRLGFGETASRKILELLKKEESKR